MPVSIVEINAVEHRVIGEGVGILSVLKFRVRSNFNTKLLPFRLMFHPEEKWVHVGATRPDSGHNGKLLGETSFSEFGENIS